MCGLIEGVDTDEPNRAVLDGPAMVETLDEPDGCIYCGFDDCHCECEADPDDDDEDEVDPAGCYRCGSECHDGPCREGEADDDLADPEIPEEG